ncbi:MAG: dihydropteroate synthase [Candidatus Zixiibacteriota bacterium]
MKKEILTRREETEPAIRMVHGRQLPLSHPLVMGILNVTPDSFSDGGQHSSHEAAIYYALKMEADGAHIIDIGGESTRPGAEPVDCAEELARVIPVIEGIRLQSDIPISVDTTKSEVANRAIQSGADIVNDISALRFDQLMASVVSRAKAPVVLMHMQGTPRDMQANPTYTDCIGEIVSFFVERIEYCVGNGIERSALILDPGIGFGKRLGDNLEILSGLRRLTEFGLPLLVGSSRKSFIGMVHDRDTQSTRRLGGSIASAILSVSRGASIVRVHDVADTVEALKLFEAIGSVL